MAFAAVISLTNTIERLLNSPRFSLVPASPEIIQAAYKELKSLQEILKRLDCSSKSSSRKSVNALDAQIREAVCKFEDLFESHLLNQIASQCESRGDDGSSLMQMQCEDKEEARQEINSFAKNVMKLKQALHNMLNQMVSPSGILGSERHRLLFSINLQDLKQEVDSFTERVKKMEEEYINELENPLPEEENEALSSIVDSSGKKTKMVGFYELFSRIRAELTLDFEFLAMALVGMAGIGKTTLAHEIFEDPLIVSHFQFRAWVTVGRKCQINEMAREIITQLDPSNADKMLTEADEKITHYLKEILNDKRCLIVLDDVWDTCVWNHLRSSFPGNNAGRTRILLTTRLQEVAQHTRLSGLLSVFKIMPLLNEEESWDLLRDKVFCEDSCPYELEKIGKKIAENCEGLPLTIVTVADLLSKAEKTQEYWKKVAEKQNSVFNNAYDEISKVLRPSYEYLPQYLKPCFLYMGVFPQDYEIPRSKLINMWIAEGLLEPNIISKAPEYYAMKCLQDLVSNSLVIFRQRSSDRFYQFDNAIITCRLHSSFWYLCKKEAGKNKFFHVLNTRVDSLEEGIKGQRRLCIHNNILLGIKDAYNSMEDDCASTARSLLCFGSYHQYQVPICSRLRLLKVLDALKIRLYEFPMEVLKLVQLRYLALTYNGDLPQSISKLWNLQFLIIHRHLSIKSRGAPSYVPMEIWDMQELKHLQIMGSNLRNINGGASLKNLSTLLGVSAESCTKGVLKRISNLKKLGIQIELVPDGDDTPLHCLNQVSHLRRLESLKCVVINPELRSDVVAQRLRLSTFPSGLKKLSLSGLGYPWKEMSKIASLPNLEVLKLRCYAFRGPKWEIEDRAFFKLRFLLIEDTDLVQLKVGYGSFIFLNCFSIKHCYKLEKIRWKSDRNTLQKIEVVDCNSLVVTWVNRMKKKAQERRRRDQIPEPDFFVHSSWDDGNLNS